jgi:hypothetical protein
MKRSANCTRGGFGQVSVLVWILATAVQDYLRWLFVTALH